MDKRTQVPIIQVHNLVNAFGKQIVHDLLDLTIYRGEVLGLVGASGAGKSVLLHTILGLHRPSGGEVRILGKNIAGLSFKERAQIDQQCGVLFQGGALFSSLSVSDNIQVPLRELARLKKPLTEEVVFQKLSMVGLPAATAFKYPSELSGGMTKRAALARALVLDPEILFLDEPTSGLDPISAGAFDSLINELKSNLNLTVVMVTHDLDSLKTICNRIAVLVDKQVIVGTVDEIMANKNPWIQKYFHGARAKAVWGE
ncbi:MAG: ABC transporter ATP-binding protein [Alphaproteobacteria bacterium]|jgi:phospholipid/cholesterol/gamma-HCH transport system ATP-binding protein|nr:ABC transporter ATP-binding protein [Alphaproteobacteria bacterium]MBT5389645.1 ABC transporter ATP-binding protein [Alphaproteobacteria bacterium]MBT5540414.1 ABC transporter ATP-binding protein [Alphaproteobacteria bacterium]MBT5654125.1 ABC transporter ATP-binding protein [Alphaproteobacteria bacterium]